MADELDPLREAYGPDSLSTADVRDLYRAPVRRYADPSPEERSTFAPLVKPRGSSEYELGVPGAIMEPWHAIKALMGHGYQPGTGDEQGIRNSTDVAGALAGYGTMAGAPSGALASNAARIGHNAGPPMEGKLPWSAPRVEPTVPNVPLAPGNKYGFYSKIEDALHRFSDNDTVTPQKLSQMGVSKAEMEARLPGFTGGTKAGDLHALAAENPVALRESKYSSNLDPLPGEAELAAKYRAQGMAPDQAAVMASKVVGARNNVVPQSPKWSNWATDPSPTANYGESVLHMPPERAELDRLLAERAKLSEQITPTNRAIPEGMTDLSRRIEALQEKARGFQSGHWSEPNVMAHTRYSTLKDVYGKPVLLADEIQSDWGQKLREGGVRDEAKIADLGKRLEDAEQHHTTSDTAAHDFLTTHRGDLEGADFWNEGGKPRKPPTRLDEKLDLISEYGPPHLRDDAQTHLMDLVHAKEAAKLLRAEYETARASTPGHPLVNTTDQWTTTAMRHLLQKAHEAGAEGIALTPGQVQLDRYPNLSQVASGLRYNPTTQYLEYAPTTDRFRNQWQTFTDNSGRRNFKPEDLPGVIGKEMTEALLAQAPVYDKPSLGDWHTLNDLGQVKIGGQGMLHAYDKMYVDKFKQMLRKMDPEHPGRSETRLVPSDFDPAGMVGANGQLNRIGHKYQRYQDMADGTPFANPFHYFPLTPKVKQAIERGLPLFSEGGAVPSLRDYYGDKK